LIILLENGSLFLNIGATMLRIILGFCLGSILGVLLGLLMGTSPLNQAVLTPYVDFLRFVSSLAWISTFMIWFGTGETSKVVVLIYGMVFGVAINVTAGVLALSRAKLRAARCLGATPTQVFFAVVLPGSVPFILAGMRLGLQNSFMGIVAAEMIAASKGLGFLIMNSRNFLAPDRILVAILALGVLGYLSDRVLAIVGQLALGKYQLPD
jgi:NitT/TauT family transport system permease protein